MYFLEFNTGRCRPNCYFPRVSGLLAIVLIILMLPLPMLSADNLTVHPWQLADEYDTTLTESDGDIGLDNTLAPSKKGLPIIVENDKSIFTDESTHIISPAASDKHKMRVSAIYNSGTGNSERSDAVGGLVRYEIEDFILGAKYLSALDVGEFSGDNQAENENSWGVSLTYQVGDPLTFDFHYEKFDADPDADNYCRDQQYGMSATYTFSFQSQWDCNLTSGYRKIKHDTSGDSRSPADLDEFSILFNLGF